MANKLLQKFKKSHGFNFWYLIPNLENIFPSKFAFKKKIYLVGKIQMIKRLKQKFLWMKVGYFANTLLKLK